MPQWARVGHVRQLHGWHVVFLAEVNEGAQLSCHLDAAQKNRTSTISTSAGPPDARARSTSANFDFGQFFFDFGQLLDVEFWDNKEWGPEGWGPEGWRPRRVEPRRVGGPKFRAFFPFPATIIILLSL